MISLFSSQNNPHSSDKIYNVDFLLTSTTNFNQMLDKFIVIIHYGTEENNCNTDFDQLLRMLWDESDSEPDDKLTLSNSTLKRKSCLYILNLASF